jgi:hypothetical protein
MSSHSTTIVTHVLNTVRRFYHYRSDKIVPACMLHKPRIKNTARLIMHNTSSLLRGDTNHYAGGADQNQQISSGYSLP